MNIRQFGCYTLLINFMCRQNIRVEIKMSTNVNQLIEGLMQKIIETLLILLLIGD